MSAYVDYNVGSQGSDAGFLFVPPAILSTSPSSVGSHPGATLAGTQAGFTVEDFCFMVRSRRPTEYGLWANIIQSTTNPKVPYYLPNVEFYPAWRWSFKVFFQDVGPRPSKNHVFERFPNRGGNYEPGNVQWITRVDRAARDDKHKFLSHLKRMPNGCLEWQLFCDSNGYGWVRRRGIRNSYIYAHRYAWFLEYGKWPEPQALHHCDNPPCCDITHLYEGTQQNNIEDMIARGRHAWQKAGRMAIPKCLN